MAEDRSSIPDRDATAGVPGADRQRIVQCHTGRDRADCDPTLMVRLSSIGPKPNPSSASMTTPRRNVTGPVIDGDNAMRGICRLSSQARGEL